MNDFTSAGPSGKLEFSCQQCGRRLQASAEHVGRQMQCPACGTIQVARGDGAGPTVASPTSTVPTTVATAEKVAPPGVVSRSADAAVRQGSATEFPAVNRAGSNSPISPGGPPTATAVNVRLTLPRGDEPGGEAATPTKELFERILHEVGKLYVGQDELVLGSLVALFSSGHVLIESVPGLGKTLFVRTLGRILGCDFGRIQFTADLMPSDITGAPFFDMKNQEFKFRPGPVFTQLLLADEINRSPAKTHAALLEIMQEYRVTIDGVSHRLTRPFLVLATQNPIESEGTYNLPEAQLDRFMFKLVADYPGQEEEAEILRLHSQQIDINKRLEEEIQTVASPEQIMEITRQNSRVRVDDKLLNYINEIVRMTRAWPGFHLGASPRAGIALMQGARTLAAFCGRDYAVPDDVAQIALPALRHRVILSAEAEVEGNTVDQLLTELIRSVEVPRL